MLVLRGCWHAVITMAYQPEPDPICECVVCHWKAALSLTITHNDLPYCPKCLRPVEILIPPQQIILRYEKSGHEYDPLCDTK